MQKHHCDVTTLSSPYKHSLSSGNMFSHVSKHRLIIIFRNFVVRQNLYMFLLDVITQDLNLFLQTW